MVVVIIIMDALCSPDGTEEQEQYLVGHKSSRAFGSVWFSQNSRMSFSCPSPLWFVGDQVAFPSARCLARCHAVASNCLRQQGQ